MITGQMVYGADQKPSISRSLSAILFHLLNTTNHRRQNEQFIGIPLANS